MYQYVCHVFSCAINLLAFLLCNICYVLYCSASSMFRESSDSYSLFKVFGSLINSVFYANCNEMLRCMNTYPFSFFSVADLKSLCQNTAIQQIKNPRLVFRNLNNTKIYSDDISLHCLSKLKTRALNTK